MFNNQIILISEMSGSQSVFDSLGDTLRILDMRETLGTFPMSDNLIKPLKQLEELRIDFNSPYQAFMDIAYTYMVVLTSNNSQLIETYHLNGTKTVNFLHQLVLQKDGITQDDLFPLLNCLIEDIISFVMKSSWGSTIQNITPIIQYFFSYPQRASSILGILSLLGTLGELENEPSSPHVGPIDWGHLRNIISNNNPEYLPINNMKIDLGNLWNMNIDPESVRTSNGGNFAPYDYQKDWENFFGPEDNGNIQINSDSTKPVRENENLTQKQGKTQADFGGFSDLLQAISKVLIHGQLKSETSDVSNIYQTIIDGIVKDSLDDFFITPAFQNFTNLKRLIFCPMTFSMAFIQENSVATSIWSHTFQYLPSSVTELYFSEYLLDLRTNAFMYFTHILVLDLSNNTIPGSDISSCLQNISNLPSLERFYFNNVKLYFEVLGVPDFPTISSKTLQLISMEHNGFQTKHNKFINFDFEKMWNLKYLTLSHNGYPNWFSNDLVYRALIQAENLTMLNISNQVDISAGSSIHNIDLNESYYEMQLPERMEWLDVSNGGVHITHLPKVNTGYKLT